MIYKFEQVPYENTYFFEDDLKDLLKQCGGYIENWGNNDEYDLIYNLVNYHLSSVDLEDELKAKEEIKYITRDYLDEYDIDKIYNFLCDYKKSGYKNTIENTVYTLNTFTNKEWMGVELRGYSQGDYAELFCQAGTDKELIEIIRCELMGMYRDFCVECEDEDENGLTYRLYDFQNDEDLKKLVCVNEDDTIEIKTITGYKNTPIYETKKYWFFLSLYFIIFLVTF